MVKQILAFLRWQLSKFTWRDYYFMSALVLIIVGLKSSQWLVLIGTAAVLLMALHTLVKLQWDQWKRERQDLLDKIKHAK